MIFTAKNKTHLHVAIQVQVYLEKPKKLRLFSHKKKHQPWELIAQYAWNRPASSTSKSETQSGKIK